MHGFTNYFPSNKCYRSCILGNTTKKRNIIKQSIAKICWPIYKVYKNKHLGERCFIVATGPSLTMEDLELIKNEYSFGMNSIPKIFPRTTWRPTYFGIQDCNVYEKMQSTIFDSYKSADNVFISDSIADKFPIPENFMQFPYDAVYHDNYLEVDKYFAKFSDDCYAIVYDGYSITYSLIQIAVYMGFKEIYLLGADCSYKRGARNHVVDSGNAIFVAAFPNP